MPTPPAARDAARDAKVLVANRGEIACRVIRACREQGIPSVAIYSDADAEAVHTWLADEAVHVGASESAQSYLQIERVLEAAKRTGATLIHPGYGFLSENPVFREMCEAAGIGFVGPSADAMRKMGVKTLARDAMRAAGVPVVPGSDGPVADADAALIEAETIGYPVMLKAASGGGGKGMRLVHRPEDLRAAFEGAAREAQAYFGDATIYIEKAIVQPRHIEIQVLADRLGQTIHLYERECSVQRRNQKIIEESPAAHLSDATRSAMGEVAVRAAQAVDYEGAGTIEFLVDADERFYFLEMNTRLQVEHPVTEWVTGVDLVGEQLRVALGMPLSVCQEDIVQRGHSIECRVYAEDPARAFMPSPGTLRVYRPPLGPGVRVDDGVVEGCEVSSHYDPMIAKLSTWAPNRDHALGRMRAALRSYEIAGIAHNISYLLHILDNPGFAAGRYDTGLVESMGPFEPTHAAEPMAMALAAVLEHREANGRRPQPTQDTSEAAWAAAARQWGLRRG